MRPPVRLAKTLLPSALGKTPLSLLFSEYSSCSFSLCFRIRATGWPLCRAPCLVEFGWLAAHEGEALGGPSAHCAAKNAPRSVKAALESRISGSRSCHPRHRLMQLLPRGMQELPCRQRKTASEQ